MTSPMIGRSTPTGERLFIADQQGRHPTPIRRLSLMNEHDNQENQNVSSIYGTPMGMTIVPPDDMSGSVSHLEAPSAARELGTELENTLGSMSGRRGRRGGAQSLPLQHTPLPHTSALVVPGSHSKAHMGSVSSKKSRSRRSMSRYWGENEDPTEREVQKLQSRFNAIQVGLGSIDHERARLFEKSKELEEEKLALEKQLELRDNEIHALVRRCATQEEKIRESSTIRSQNRELATNLESMVNKLETMKASSTSLHDLKRQLAESENARKELQKRLEWVETEHDSIATTLKECLENIRRLTDEKQQLEEDRIRERKRSEIELEKQRLSMVQISNDLQSDLQRKQQQIDDMELIIQQQNLKRDTASTMSSTRDSVGGGPLSVIRYDDHLQDAKGSFESDILDARLKKTVERYEKQIADMKMQVESHVEQIMVKEEEKRQEAASEYERQIEWMRKELLQNGSNEGRMFELQSKLAEQGVEMTREKESSHQVREAAERYEKTISELSTMLEEKNQEVRDVNEANIDLQEQIARHEMDLQSQGKNIKNYEEKIEDLEKLLFDQEQELQANEETLVKNTEQYEEKVSELEKRLLEQKQELQSSKDSFARMQEINGEKEALASTHEMRITQLQTQISQQEIELQTRATKIDSLESQVREHDARLKNLLAGHETNTTLLQTKMKQKETELQFAKTEYEGRIARLENELTDQRHAQMAKEAENRKSLQEKLDQKETELLQVKDESSSARAKLKECEKKLEEQGEILRSREEMNEKLREMKKESDDTMSQLTANYEVKVTSLKLQLCEQTEEKAEIEKKMEQTIAKHDEQMAEVSSKTERLRNKLIEMKDKLDEREERIANVETEFAEQMQELMNKQVALDKAEDRRKHLEAQIGTLQHFEDEHAAMVHYIEIMESNCAELTAENGILNVEKESLIEEKSQLQEKLNGFEGRVSTLREKHAAREEEAKEDLRQQVMKLQENLEGTKRELATKTEEITKVRMETKLTLENMHVSLEKARDEIVELEDQLGWEKTLQTQPTDASEEIESLTQALEAAQEEIALQQQELERRDKRIGDLLSEIDTLNQNDREEAFIEAESQKLELEGQLANMRRREAELVQTLEVKETEIEKMKSYCNELGEKSNMLENQLLSSEEDLVEKLNAAVRDIEEKEAKLSAMRASIADKNAQYESLEKQTHRMKTELALKDDEIRDLRMVDLKDAEEEIAELKASLESKSVLEQELLSKRTFLMEQQQTINDLKMNQTRLLTKERDIMEECDRLYESEKEAKEMLSKMESEFQSMVRERENFDSDLRSKKLSQECELRKLEKEASERDEKLSEVVSLSEGLEKRLAMKENELSEQREELDSKRGEITRLRREFRGKETSLKLQLKEARRGREEAEKSLENIKRQKSEAAKYKKQMSENEKEIEGLKDKVKRQEAYMQTRIQREKIPSRTAVSTPKRSSPPRAKASAQSLAASHLARRRQSGIPSKPSSTDGAMSTPSERRKARASLLPISGFKSPGFRNELD